MSRLLVCSEKDEPSVNMKTHLLRMHGWEDMGTDGTNSYLSCGDTVMMTIPDLHIYHEELDREAEAFGVRVDDIVVMSKHSAKSGQKALTVHPIGNYHENEFGGRAQTLVEPSPALMTDALRRIVAYNDMPETQTCFEVTHHGPWLSHPTFFIEIGSDETNWGNMHAAEVLAHVITDMEPHPEYPTVVGVGGGHYAPRFTDLALSHRVNFGHMVPTYQIEGRDDEDILRMIGDACRATGTDTVYIHRKSMKKPVERHITELIESAGYQHVVSADLEPLQ